MKHFAKALVLSPFAIFFPRALLSHGLVVLRTCLVIPVLMMIAGCGRPSNEATIGPITSPAQDTHYILGTIVHFGIGGERTRSRAPSASIIGKPARPPNTNASVAQGAGESPIVIFQTFRVA